LLRQLAGHLAEKKLGGTKVYLDVDPVSLL
jgi:hypothetical protein